MNSEELRTAARSFSTPFYIFDTDLLRDRMSEIRKRTDPAISLCYAMKANQFLTAAMSELADRVEVCSPGEMKICIRQQIPADRIFMSGVNKHPEDIKEALNYGVRQFTAESLKHMRLLAQAAAADRCHIKVWPRLNAGSQFGMSIEDMILLVKQYGDDPYCHLTGLHYFTGTQRKAGRRQEKDVQIICDALSRLERECGFVPEEIEYGPGLYVPYFDEEPEDDLSGIAKISDDLRELTARYKITVETGRYFVASCGYYLTSIDDVKRSAQANYVLVDGGIHQLNYYGGNMGLRLPKYHHFAKTACPAAPEENWCVCGSLCTTADVLMRSAPLKNPAEGDILAFENVGAYSITESSALFLCREMPKVLIRKNGQLQCVREAFDSSLLICR